MANVYTKCITGRKTENKMGIQGEEKCGKGMPGVDWKKVSLDRETDKIIQIEHCGLNMAKTTKKRIRIIF